MENQDPKNEEQKPQLSKAELLEQLLETKLVQGEAKDWDNLNIGQIEALIALKQDKGSDEAQQDQEPKFDAEKFKQELSDKYAEEFTTKMAEIEKNFTANAKKADPADVKKLKEDHEKALSEEVVKRRQAEQKNKDSWQKIKSLAGQLLEATK